MIELKEHQKIDSGSLLYPEPHRYLQESGISSEVIFKTSGLALKCQEAYLASILHRDQTYAICLWGQQTRANLSDYVSRTPGSIDVLVNLIQNHFINPNILSLSNQENRKEVCF